MKMTLLLLALSAVLAAGCDGKKEPNPNPEPCTGKPECYKPAGDELYVQVHAGGRECAATFVGPDVVVTSTRCIAGAGAGDISVEVEGEVLSAHELVGDSDTTAIRVAHPFGAAR
ncbi:MAG TPA: hypothetical protein VKE22_10525 [Haliangiales bacterium]|nr:hypothetical protein [Haliangiales bacterium]